MSNTFTFDTREFRQTLGTFATGVTIITTTAADGEWVGVTANSFNSVSLDPPMVLWSLAKTSLSLAAFDAAEHWAVHILAADQEDLSNRFARRGEDKFQGLDTETGIGSVPLLVECSSRLQCRTRFKHEGGDHIIFVGEVLKFDRLDKAPLVFHAGKYAVAARKTDSSLASAPPVADASAGFGEDFIVYLLARAFHQVHADLRRLTQARDLSDAQWFVLSSLTAKNHRPLAELRSMYAITGDRITDDAMTQLQQRGFLEPLASHASEVAPEELPQSLSGAGRDLALRILAATKANEAALVARLGSLDTTALRNQLRQLIQLTDPGLPDMWGRSPR